MNDSLKISVIINCYNGEKYVESALHTVFSQTYSNWEIIFWDNKSTDGSANIVHKIGDSRIKYYLADEHTSLGKARNLALLKVNSPYACFLDIDDKWDSHFLEYTADRFLNNPDILLFYCNYFGISQKSSHINDTKSQSGYVTFKELLRNYNIAISGCVFKIEDRNNPPTFNDNFSLIEDYDFFLRILYHGSGYYDNRPLVSYLMHQDSLTYQYRDGWALEFQTEYDFLTKEFLTDEDIAKYAKELIWLKVRKVNAAIIENVVKDNRLNALKVYIRNANLSYKLSFSLIAILFGEKTYVKIRKFLSKNSYSIY